MDKEDQRDARTGGAEIVAAVGGDHLCTVVAYIFIVFHIGISGVDKGFEPPMAANHPIAARRNGLRKSGRASNGVRVAPGSV